MSSEPPKDPRIEPLDYISGVKVVDIGDLRVARGMSRRPASACGHLHLNYDSQERRIWCSDCEQNVDPFDAFTKLTEHFDRANADLRRRQEVMQEAEEHAIVSIAAKVIDKAWRRQGSVPACPVCGHGIFPEDFKRGLPSSLGKDFAAHRRAAIGKPVRNPLVSSGDVGASLAPESRF